MAKKSKTTLTADMRTKIDAMNEILKSQGLVQIDIVSPDECYAQDLNARYMTPEMLDNLVSNIKSDGALESTPLVYAVETGGYKIISGHHRIEAAKKAGLDHVMVMVTQVKDNNQLRAKQLSHNSITGLDDKAVLAKIYNSIEDLSAKYYSGLQDVIESISTTTLSFRIGVLQEFTMAFMPEDIENYDALCELLKENSKISSSAVVRVVDKRNYDGFIKALIEVKKVTIIKQDAAAFAAMLELVKERLAQIAEETERGKDQAD